MRIGQHTGNISFIQRPRLLGFLNSTSASTKTGVHNIHARMVDILNVVKQILFTQFLIDHCISIFHKSMESISGTVHGTHLASLLLNLFHSSESICKPTHFLLIPSYQYSKLSLWTFLGTIIVKFPTQLS